MDKAYPARFWWLKRLAPAAALLLILMFGSYFAVGVWANRRIASELAEWRKLPVIQPNDTGGTPADLADPKNPAFHVQAAVAALPVRTTEQFGWGNEDHQWPPLTERDVQVMRSFEAGLQPRIAALRQAREAAEKREYRWALGPLSMATLLPHLNPMREVCNQIGWSMLLAHHEGDLAGALELARGNRTLAESALEYGNFLVCSLVANGIEAYTHAQLLRLSGYEPAHRTLEEELALWRKNRTHVANLIDELLAPDFYERLAVEGMEGEWLVALTTRNAVAGWRMNLPPRNLLTAPMLDVNTKNLLAMHAQYREVLAGNKTYPARVRELAELQMPQRVTNIAGVAANDAFYDFVSEDLGRPALGYARVQTTAHAAAVVLASRLFEADHGRTPESLEELVPDYLPRMPEDPFDPAGAPLRYRVIEGLPIVYSVGRNGTDEGGSLLNPDEYGQNHDDFLFPLRYPARLNHDPLKWLRERQEAAESQ